MSTQEDKDVAAESVAASEAGFEIDGERFLIPTIDTLTLDEERILYLYADCVIKDFIPPHPSASEEDKQAHELYQARKIRNPDFKRALAYVAYRRKHPEIDDGDILKTLGAINAFELDLAILRGDDDSPPDQSSQNEPSPQSETSEPTSSTHSGSNGNGTSDRADVIPLSTGTIASGTSSLGAPPTGLAS